MLIILLMMLLGNRAKAQPVATVTVTFSKVSITQYQQARRTIQKMVPVATYPVKKVGAVLTIPTTQGPQVFKDWIVGEAEVAKGHSEDENTTFAYKGYLPGFKRHVVEVTFYETSEWWLVAENGRRLTLYGAPVYAPDQNSIATICPGIEYSGGQPNAVQLLQLKNGLLQKAWEIRPTTWEPAEIFWTSPTTLYLKREEFSATDYLTPEAGPRLSYWKLTIGQRAAQ